MADTETKHEDLVITRIIDAPVDVVWKAWTEPEHIMKWWGPKDYTSPSCSVDLKEGGRYIFCMHAPDEQGGQDQYTAGTYTKILPKERLEFDQDNITDKDGTSIDPMSIGMPADFPKKNRMVVTFTPKGNLTEVIVTSYDWTPSQMFVYAMAGWHQSIDKLAASLS